MLQIESGEGCIHVGMKETQFRYAIINWFSRNMTGNMMYRIVLSLIPHFEKPEWKTKAITLRPFFIEEIQRDVLLYEFMFTSYFLSASKSWCPYRFPFLFFTMIFFFWDTLILGNDIELGRKSFFRKRRGA